MYNLDDMRNLLLETKQVLEENGKSINDIVWVGCKDFEIPLASFLTLSDEEYDSGYGGNEVPIDLVIVGNDWWLERGEYDGAEWWEFKTLPKRPDVMKVPNTIFGSELHECIPKERKNN